MAEHTFQELQMKQALPLEAKIIMSKQRIREFVSEYGIDGVYVSFSGGKDSTVLLHLARSIFPEIPAVFIDTGLEYPEIREFVKSFENVKWLKPKMTFKQVIKKYGYPFISKEVSDCVFGARKYLTELREQGIIPEHSTAQHSTAQHYSYQFRKLCGIGEYSSSENGRTQRREQSEVADHDGRAGCKEEQAGEYP